MNRPKAFSVKYVATLAVAAGVILVGGALLRPRARSAEQPPPSQTDLERLGNLTERRALESATAFVRQVADDVAASLVWLDAASATGVVWTRTTIATTRHQPPVSPTSPTAELTDRIPIARVGWSPDLPAARVELREPTDAPPVTRASPPADAGVALVAVWRTAAGRVFAAVTSVDQAVGGCGAWPSHELRTTFVFTREMAGGGLFDLDGNLLGVILPCGDRYAALTADVVDAMLPSVDSFEHRLLARYGLVVERLTPGESAFFQATAGVIVREVRVGHAAAAAGLRPGDLVVGINGAPVGRLEEMQVLTDVTPLADARLSIERDSAALEVAMPIGATAPGADMVSASGVVVEARRAGLRVATVQPGTRAAAAGLRPDDRILRVGNREPQSPEQLRRALDGPLGGGTFVEFERDNRRRGVLLAGAPR